MKNDERDYYLKVIQLYEQMLQGVQSKNFSKMIIAQKELEKIQKSPFEEVVKEKKLQKDALEKRFKNLLTELESVVKELTK